MRSAVVGRRWWSSTSTRVPMASAASLNARCLSSRSRRHHVRWSLSTSSRSAVTVHLTLLLYLLTSACSLPVPIQSDAVVIRLLSQNLHCRYCKKKVAHTQLPSVEFRSWSRFFDTVSLQVTWVINPAVGCYYFPPGLQLPPQPLRALLPILLLGEQRHNGCEQFA